MKTLVEENMYLARAIAGKKKRQLPAHISYDEILSAAYMGLVEAASRFDESKGFAFTTFAYPRIFGAITDYLRQIGWGKRGESVIAYSLDTPLNDEDMYWKDTLESKETISDREENLEIIAKGLSPMAKHILGLYFYDNLSMKEIGNYYNISEGRVSQLILQCKSQIKEIWSKTDLFEELAA